MTLRRQPGVLVDTNLLVLLVVGAVNPRRIETFKRTRKYCSQDYDLLVQVLGKFDSIYTVPHVMAEVSNLTDLGGPESLLARRALREIVKVCKEATIPCNLAVEEDLFERLGLTDAAIASAAREHGCAVLTDDFDLYEALSRTKTEVHNFTHWRTRELAV